MSNLQPVSEDQFEAEVLQSDIPVLVDFTAEWCGPCKALAPILDEVVGDFEGKLKGVSVDIDQNPQLAAGFEIRSVPTIIFFKGGEPVDTMVGAAPKKTFVEKVEALV